MFKNLVAGLSNLVELPGESEDCYHVWNQYSIRFKRHDRDEVRTILNEKGIGSEVYYPVPLHQQSCFLTLFSDPDSLNETNAAAAEVLSLPIFPEMTVEEQNAVVDRLVACLMTENQSYKMAS